MADISMKEIGKGYIIHDEMALFLIHFQEEGMVGDDVAVVQVFDIGEVALEEEDVLTIQSDRFHCEGLETVPVLTFFNDTMSTLTDLLTQLVLLQ